MCGVAGFLDGGCSLPEGASATARAMAGAVAHRGPDDAGVWLDREAGIALAHRRLAVIDLSPAGRQPMLSASGRSVIVFNGEIYNHSELRRRIETRFPNAAGWRGRSDTETLLAAIECWGLEEALRAAAGMFALALWDRKDRTLSLARDRMGEKPLYYGWQNGVFLFGSELKVLAAHPAFGGGVDRNALALLLRDLYISSPWSIYEGIRKLPAGACIRISAGRGRKDTGEMPEPRPWWSLRNVIEAGRARPFEGTPEEAVGVLHDVLVGAVRRQMVADVPLGAFLSGGIDSSAIVALMQAQARRPVRTFTIGFEKSAYDEAPYARALARRLETEHTELYVSARDALDVIPRLPTLFDEPFADSSQIPTFLVAGMARRHVTVALSGDGGDELFGGYLHYTWTPRFWRMLLNVPTPLRCLGARAVATALSPGFGQLPTRVLNRTELGRKWLRRGAGARRLAWLMDSRTPEQLYYRQRSLCPKPALVVRGASEPATILSEPASWPNAPELEHRLMAVDALNYLPDDILVKVDRAAMGVSLETRAPFLDHRVVEFVWRLPLSVKIRNGRGKWVLRQVLYNYVPKELVDRPKKGFAVPLASWLRGPLRDWAEALLDERRLRSEGFFDPGAVRRRWSELLSQPRRRQSADHLWSILMFQAWLEHGRRGHRPGGGAS